MDFLDRILDYYQKPTKLVEEELDLSNGYFNKTKMGKIKEPTKLISALKRKGLNPNYFLTGEGSPELLPTRQEGGRGGIKELQEVIEGKLIPFLAQTVSAGNGAELHEYEDTIGLICLPEAAVKGQLRALRVKGDSMEPTLRPGDIVVCDMNGWQGDGLYVLRDENSAYVKRVRRVREGLEVLSDNTAYKPWSCPSEELVVIGRVCFSVVRL